MWAMWIIDLLPMSVIHWVLNICLVVGAILTLVGFLLGNKPLVMQYRLPIQIAGLVLLVAGVYFSGGYAEREIWKARVAEIEVKIAEAEVKAKEANDKLDAQLNQDVKTIKGETEYIIKEIPKYITVEVDRACKIPEQTIEQFNRAAKGEFNALTISPK